MYKIKEIGLLEEYNKVKVAEKIGLHPDTLRKILNGKQECSKLVSYCITKYIDSDAEIENYFIKVDEE